MPNFDSTQQRREKLLSQLIRYANYELEEQYGHLHDKLKTKWLQDNSSSPCIQVETTLNYLSKILDRSVSTQDLSYDLKVLKKVEILTDERFAKQGKPQWRFTLKLWDKHDLDKNISKFRELMQSNKNNSEKNGSEDIERELELIEDLTEENNSDLSSSDARSRDRNNGDKSNPKDRPSVCIPGTLNSSGDIIITIGDNNNYGISSRLKANRQLVIENILNTIDNLDRRLSSIDTALTPTPLESELSELRQKVIPSIAVENTMSWWRLMSQQTAASLQHTFNSQPIDCDLNLQLISELPAELNRKNILDFKNAISEVRYCTDVLLKCFQDIASNPSLSPKDRDFYADKVSLESKCLANRSQLAYLQALAILGELADNPVAIEHRISSLNHLQPQQLLPQSKLAWMITHLENNAAELSLRRDELVRASMMKLQEQILEFGRLDRLLEIQSTDSWNQVVAKAISLRKFGRIGEAIAAFDRYREMFSSDPTASEYTRIAQQFTLQISDLQLDGGVYVYEVNPKIERIEGAFQIGDIIIGYGDRQIQNMVDITEALRDTTIGDVVRISYLRCDCHGNFQSQICNLVGKPLGLGLMPI